MRAILVDPQPIMRVSIIQSLTVRGINKAQDNYLVLLINLPRKTLMFYYGIEPRAAREEKWNV